MGDGLHANIVLSKHSCLGVRPGRGGGVRGGTGGGGGEEKGGGKYRLLRAYVSDR
jgi:hypothetical protein